MVKRVSSVPCNSNYHFMGCFMRYRWILQSSSDREYVTMDEGLDQFKKSDKSILCSHIV